VTEGEKNELADNIAREMGLNAKAIALRKEFLELGERDVALLRAIHQHMAGMHVDDFFTDLFYSHLRAFPELQQFIPDDATVERLKAVQTQYFNRLTSGEYDEAYILDRLRVGYAHQRIGLEPKWYTGAYRKYLSFLLSVVHEMADGDTGKFLASYDALLKIVFFDMELALDTYFHSDRQELARMANYDALTGLPNRYLLSDRIAQAIHQAHREQNHVAILFIDLDRFKNINDSLGHAIGDKVICEVSARLAASLREGDTLARLGGDEFVAVLPAVAQQEYIANVAGKLLRCVEHSIAMNGAELFAAASIGIAVYPEDGANQHVLLKNADSAMYQAKQEGGATFRFYRKEMNMLSLSLLRIEARLHSALKNNEFTLHYQPQVEMASGRIVGVEALLRWQPHGVIIPPVDFISIMEETGLIIPIGNWVLETACRQVVTWRRAGMDSITVAVNLSARQFLGQDLVETISGALSRTGCDPSWLELEITESVMMQSPERAAATLKSLADMGIAISIDDFGTGYSSLAYLRQFPVHSLKIDRSFVSNIGSIPEEEAIVRAVITLAHGLHIQVVAEGVEKDRQREFLLGIGCDCAQGYCYSRPLPAREITRLLRDSPVLGCDSVRNDCADDGVATQAEKKSMLDISRCRVRRIDAHHVECLIEQHCRYMLPYGSLCGHPLVDVIAVTQ
jgi:diguanylate cyclase (GGDEF)-like protein